LRETISFLANLALCKLQNDIGGHLVLAEFPDPPAPPRYDLSPLGRYLGQCMITTELKALWQLPARRENLESSCRTALSDIVRDLRSITEADPGCPEEGWDDKPNLPQMQIVFARPAMTGEVEQAICSDRQAGIALRATRMNEDTIAIAVNFGVRRLLQCRFE
jgi:hypothetical protein